MQLQRFKTFLHEDHAQIEMFDGGRKPIHVQFIDAIEELAKQKKFPSYQSKQRDVDTIYHKALKAGIKEVWDEIDAETCGSILGEWLEMHINDENIYYMFSDDFISNEGFKEGEISPDDLRNSFDNLRQYGLSAFSEKGKKQLQHDLPKIVEYILNQGEGRNYDTLYDVLAKNLNGNKDGLINCYRAIVIDGSKMSEPDDVYNEITKAYKSVGIYWSWAEEGAEPHNGYSSSPSRLDVTLHGQTRVEDIAWARTVFVNVYDLKEEREITIDGFVKIVAVEFKTADGKKAKHEIEGGLIVPVAPQPYKRHYIRKKAKLKV